jgi:4-hydroxy-tetrahydrodipicolinate synthase
MVSTLRGIIAAVPTPVDSNGIPDRRLFLKHARWCLEQGCDGLNVLGTTGEANSLPEEYRLDIMEAASAELDAKRMMVGTGTSDLATTISLTRKAHQLRFAGALLLPPYYYKGLADAAFFAWFEAIIAATNDAPISLYLYNFPQMTGIRFSPDLIRHLREAFPGRIVGIKDSSGDLEYSADLAHIEGFDVFPSNEAAVARVNDGYAGCISATVNVSAKIAGALWADKTNSLLLERLGRVRTQISAQPLIPAVKYLVSRIHEDSAFANTLLPLLPLNAAQKAALDLVEYSG